MVTVSSMGDKRSSYLEPEAAQSSFVRGLMTASPTVLLRDQLHTSRPSSRASSVGTESRVASPDCTLPPKAESSPALSVNSSHAPSKSAPGSPAPQTATSDGSFTFDEEDDLGSLSNDKIGSTASKTRRGRSASLDVPMLRVTTTELSTPRSPRTLQTSNSSNLLSVNYPTRVPDAYFGKAKRVERTNSFPLRRQQTITERLGDVLATHEEQDKENTADTTSAYETDDISYEETVSELSTLDGPDETFPNDDLQAQQATTVQGPTSATDVTQPASDVALRRKTFSTAEDGSDNTDKQRPPMTKQGTFTKDSPTHTLDGQTQPVNEEQSGVELSPAEKEATNFGSTHTLLDKVQLENDTESGYVEQDSDDPTVLAERLKEVELNEDGLEETFHDNEGHTTRRNKLKKRATIDDVLGPELTKLGLEAPSSGSPTPRSRPPSPEEQNQVMNGVSQENIHTEGENEISQENNHTEAENSSRGKSQNNNNKEDAPSRPASQQSNCAGSQHGISSRANAEGTPSPDRENASPTSNKSHHSRPNSALNEESSRPGSRRSSTRTYTPINDADNESEGNNPSEPGTPSQKKAQTRASTPNEESREQSEQSLKDKENESRPDAPAPAASTRASSKHSDEEDEHSRSGSKHSSLVNETRSEASPSDNNRPETPVSESKQESRPKTPVSETKGDPRAPTPVSESKPDSRPETPVSETKEDSRPGTPLSESKQESRPETPVSDTKEVSRPGTPLSESKQEWRSETPVSETKNDSRPVTPVSESKQESGPETPVAETKNDSRPGTPVSGCKPESRPETPVSENQHKSGPETPISESKEDSSPETPDSDVKDMTRSLSLASAKDLEKDPSRPSSRSSDIHQSRPTTPRFNERQSSSEGPLSDKIQSRQTTRSDMQSRSTTNDNFLRSPIVSRPNTPIRSVPLDSEEAKIHSQSTTLLIDEMIQATISKAESNVNKLEDALSIERSVSYKTEDSESVALSGSNDSVHSERRRDTPLPPKDLTDSYDDEEFEDEDDMSRPNSYHSMPETKEQTDPDIDVIHGDDGPKVKSDSDLDILVGDDTKEGNILMASLSVDKPQQRPLSPVPPSVAKTTTANTPPTRKTFRRAGNTSTLPLRQSKSLSPRTIGPRTITSPRGRPANRGVGRGIGNLGKVRPPPKRPMPTLNDKPRIKLSPGATTNRGKPLGPVWRPVGRATVKTNMWMNPSQPLPPVAKKRGISPAGEQRRNFTKAVDKQPLVTGKPKIPSQLQSEAWWQNGRFNITIRGPETVLPALPSCLVSVNPGSDINGEQDTIIPEPIDVQITFRPEENRPQQSSSYMQNYFRGGAPIHKEAKPADRNVIDSRAAYPTFNTRIDTPKGVRGRLRTDRKPVSAYVKASSNPLNPNPPNAK